MPYWEVNIHCRGNERQSDKIEYGTASTKARIAFLAAILRSIELCGRTGNQRNVNRFGSLPRSDLTSIAFSKPLKINNISTEDKQNK